MGLTVESVGHHAVDGGLFIQKETPEDRVVALAGNPNVGKSTVFNSLTGMNQHTGNWPGKTVTNAQGRCMHNGRSFILVDIPGTYSLMAHSAEEEVARDFVCFGSPDAVIVVCDATCLERNLNLVLQTIEITSRVVVCVNLMDEAERKHIHIDIGRLQKILGVPVVPSSARKEKGLTELMNEVDKIIDQSESQKTIFIPYPAPVEAAIRPIAQALAHKFSGKINIRWLALRLLEGDSSLLHSASKYLDTPLELDEEITSAVASGKEILQKSGITAETLRDQVVSSLIHTAESVCKKTVCFEKQDYNKTDRRIDKILTSKWTGIPIMLLLLAGIFWLTITGANYPSELLSNGLFWVQDRLTAFFQWAGAPDWLHGMLVLGVYRVLAWVVSVMLPPMAIFFPLFTLLEDLGYLPRVAFNLDKYFKKACACGKQALTMCMGFGCNAAGIVGCRIIDSPRERLIATITNNFVPCNGRFAQPYKGKPFPITGPILTAQRSKIEKFTLLVFLS